MLRSPIKRAGPKPRTVPKKPNRYCAAGKHIKSPRRKPSSGCLACATEQRAIALAAANTPEAVARFREERRRDLGLGPPPVVLTIRTHDGQVISFYPGPSRRR